MKRVRLFTACFLAGLLALCACSGTYKDIQEFWTAKNDDAQMAELTSKQASAPYAAPQSAALQTKTTDIKTTLTVQAQISMPKTTNIPVLQIAPRTIDQAFVDMLIKAFAKEKPVYAFDIGENSIFRTKEQTQKLLNEMEKELNDPNSVLSKIKSIDPDNYAISKKFLDSKIQSAENFLSGPNIPPKVADTSVVPKQLYNSTSNVAHGASMWFAEKPDILYTIAFGQNDDAKSYSIMLDRLDGKTYDTIDHYVSNTSDLASVGIGYQNALVQAKGLVASMGADYMSLAFSGKGRCGLYMEPFYSREVPTDEFYAFVFVRSYNGIQEHIQRSGFYGGATFSDSEANLLWNNEYLAVCIDKDGLRNVTWQSPSTLVKVVNENVQLAPFDQVLNTLQSEGVIHLRALNWVCHQKPYTDEFLIDRISLGFFKVIDPQEKGKYLLIPSWQLSGSYHIYIPDKYWDWFLQNIGVPSGNTVYTQDKGQFAEKFPLIDYMEINALSANIFEKKWF